MGAVTWSSPAQPEPGPQSQPTPQPSAQQTACEDAKLTSSEASQKDGDVKNDLGEEQGQDVTCEAGSNDRKVNDKASAETDGKEDNDETELEEEYDIVKLSPEKETGEESNFADAIGTNQTEGMEKEELQRNFTILTNEEGTSKQTTEIRVPEIDNRNEKREDKKEASEAQQEMDSRDRDVGGNNIEELDIQTIEEEDDPEEKARRERKREEMEDFKQKLAEKRSERQRAIASIAEEMRSLRKCSEDLESEREERRRLEAHVIALKDVAAISREMLRIREIQVTDLKAKLENLESTCQTDSAELRVEYEKQMENIRSLRQLYDERAVAMTTEHQREIERERAKVEVLEVKIRDQETALRDHADETAELRQMAEKEKSEHEKTRAELNELKEKASSLAVENKTLSSQMTLINNLFSHMLTEPDLDFDKLTSLLKENHNLINDLAVKGDINDTAALLVHITRQIETPNETAIGSSKEPRDSTSQQAIAANLPKVWRVLLELLSHYSAPIAVPEADKTNGCYKDIETPYGTRTVISVSQTFLRLKDLILEKNSLVKEVGRLKTLNTHLESRLENQEKRLSVVSNELHKTWGVVSKLRMQHKQLHTSEQILRYELQHKRLMLNELKEELEYCRVKWEEARKKNDQSEEDWQELRKEFAERKMRQTSNSAESGYDEDDSGQIEEASDSPSEDADEIDLPIDDDDCPSSESISPEPTVRPGYNGQDTGSKEEGSLAAKEMKADELVENAHVSLQEVLANEDTAQQEVTPTCDKDVSRQSVDASEVTSENVCDRTSPEEQHLTPSTEASQFTSQTDTECNSVGVEETAIQKEFCEVKHDSPAEPAIEEESKTESSQSSQKITPSVEGKSEVDSSLPPVEQTTLAVSNLKGTAKVNEDIDKETASGIIFENEKTDRSSEKLNLLSKKAPTEQILEFALSNISSDRLKKEKEGTLNIRLESEQMERSPDSIYELKSVPNSARESPEALVITNKSGEAEESTDCEVTLDARALRLKRLEEQCSSLLNKMTKTSKRGDSISDRLEQLHAQYGSSEVVASDSDSETNLTPIAQKTEEATITETENINESRSCEEILDARALRLKRLEEQCTSLLNKMSRTSKRGDSISNKLDQLHEQYGSSEAGTSDSDSEQKTKTDERKVTEQVSDAKNETKESDEKRNCGEVLEARALRLKRLEKQCTSLLSKMSRTSQRGDSMSEKLEELHTEFGSTETSDTGSDRTRSTSRPKLQRIRRHSTPTSDSTSEAEPIASPQEIQIRTDNSSDKHPHLSSEDAPNQAVFTFSESPVGPATDSEAGLKLDTTENFQDNAVMSSEKPSPITTTSNVIECLEEGAVSEKIPTATEDSISEAKNETVAELQEDLLLCKTAESKGDSEKPSLILKTDCEQPLGTESYSEEVTQQEGLSDQQLQVEDVEETLGVVVSSGEASRGDMESLQETFRNTNDRLENRALRLKMLENQCQTLFKRVSITSYKREALSNRLEDLHEHYGSGDNIMPLETVSTFSGNQEATKSNVTVTDEAAAGFSNDSDNLVNSGSNVPSENLPDCDQNTKDLGSEAVLPEISTQTPEDSSSWVESGDGAEHPINSDQV